MIKVDPIIAVKDVERSSKWYEQVFGFTRNHGGDSFAVLVSDDNEIILCLHKWEEHNHPTIMNADIPAGNGLLLYFRTDNMNRIYQNVVASGSPIEEEIHLNTNSRRQEFSFRDPDGYFLTVTAFHEYQ